MSNNVTIFKNILHTDTPFHRDVLSILERVKDGTSKELVKKIRLEKDKTKRNELKKGLPAVCFSGTFKKRADNALIEHSGLICLDFDGYEKQKSMLEDKEGLCRNKYTFSVFISPSGNGLKVLVKVTPDPENHVNYFNSLEKYFASPRFDKTSKNISRVCYESYDPLLFVNENSSIWDTVEEPEFVEVVRNRDGLTIPITDENKIVEILVKWWLKKFPMVEGERNHNVFVLAMAMNEFGVNKSLASYIIEPYATHDFTKTEINRTIDSAYEKTAVFGTKYYEDEDRVNSIKQKLKRGVSRSEIKHILEETNLDGNIIEAVLNRAEEENNKLTFWEKSPKGAIKILHNEFKGYLEDSGFYKYCPEGGKTYVFVKVTNNLVDHTSEKEIKDYVLSYLHDIEDKSIYNYFADNTRFFKDEFLSMLSTLEIYFISDTKDTAFLYYRNCAIKITPEAVTKIDYLDLGGYVWKDHVIDRNFNICDISDKSDYKRFVINICGGDMPRVETMRSTIGFLMHGYKNLSFCPAVILNDEVISDNPEGGTGKGIFMNALGHMKKLVVIDGKSFTFERAFAYQLVSADTQILCFDDSKKYFDFERLFSVVSEGLTMEKKNKDAIKIPFAKSPKIAITTNYAIKGSGNSFARRKWELELHQYYSKDFSPMDEFGKLLFGDWNDEEWCEFDNYMVSCLKDYLNTGLVKSQFVNLKIRQLSAETSHEFIEWCGVLDDTGESVPMEVGVRYYKQEKYYEFILEYPDYGPKSRMTISRSRFYKWMTAYAVFRGGVTPEEGRDVEGRWMRIRMKHEREKQGRLEI